MPAPRRGRLPVPGEKPMGDRDVHRDASRHAVLVQDHAVGVARLDMVMPFMPRRPHTQRIASCARSRAISEVALRVPTISTVSGITLLLVPAVTLVQVTTTGSKAPILRVTIVCNASPI